MCFLLFVFQKSFFNKSSTNTNFLVFQNGYAVCVAHSVFVEQTLCVAFYVHLVVVPILCNFWCNFKHISAHILQFVWCFLWVLFVSFAVSVFFNVNLVCPARIAFVVFAICFVTSQIHKNTLK